MSDISESRFYMWRTIFAMAHADEDVSPREIRFMAEKLEDVSFTQEQSDILKRDIVEPQPIEDMFQKITDPADQALFFSFAREMVWADGDFSPDEQEILSRLQRLHLEFVNVDDLVGGIELQFEDDEPKVQSVENKPEKNKHGDVRFREKFLRTLKYDNKNHKDS